MEGAQDRRLGTTSSVHRIRRTTRPGSCANGRSYERKAVAAFWKVDTRCSAAGGRPIGCLAAAASAALSITFPADWITQHSMRDSRLVGTSPSGDWCLLGTGKGANLGATQDDIDRKLAFLPDVLVAPLLRFVVSESKEEDREIISGGTRLLHSHRVLWIEATLRDRPGWKIRVLAVPAPHTTYLLVCAFHS